MSFLRTHGAAASVGHLLGAGLFAMNLSPEAFLSDKITPVLDFFTGLVAGTNFNGVVPFFVPDVFEPWQMLFVTVTLFLLLTMPGGTKKDEVFGDAGLDENLEASRTEFALMRYGVAVGYVVGFFVASRFGLLGVALFPASAVGIPLAFFLAYVLATVSAAWMAAGCAYLNICPRARTAAEVFGKSADARSPAKVLRRNLGMY